MKAVDGDELAGPSCSFKLGSTDGAQLQGRFCSFHTNIVELGEVQIGDIDCLGVDWARKESDRMRNEAENEEEEGIE